jgi:hypothetical protein
MAMRTRSVAWARLRASDTALPDSDSRQTKASIFWGPVLAAHCWAWSREVSYSPPVLTVSTILMPGLEERTSL